MPRSSRVRTLTRSPRAARTSPSSAQNSPGHRIRSAHVGESERVSSVTTATHPTDWISTASGSAPIRSEKSAADRAALSPREIDTTRRLLSAIRFSMEANRRIVCPLNGAGRVADPDGNRSRRVKTASWSSSNPPAPMAPTTRRARTLQLSTSSHLTTHHPISAWMTHFEPSSVPCGISP